MVACATLAVPGAPALGATDGGRGADPTPGGDEVSNIEVGIVIPESADDLEISAPVPTVSADEGGDVEVTAEYRSTPDRVETPIVEVDAFQTLGVTWPAGLDATGLDVQVRTRADGEWSEWTPLEVSDAVPDRGTPEAELAVRAGTEAVWAGQADAAQVSFAAPAVDGQEGLNLSLVDVPADAVTAPDAAVGPLAAAGDPLVGTLVGPPQWVARYEEPTVITRAEWGAADPLPDDVCGGMSVASTLVGAVVHHTAGSNGYSTVEEAMQQIRGDQAYHQVDRGWCDLGYNFVVDKWGNIYEGRAGSLTEPVVGVHAGGFNTATVGVAMLGNYSGAGEDPNQLPEDVVGSLPDEASEGVAQIIALRLRQYERDPGGTFTYTKIDGVTKVDLPVVFAHRDVSNTICPGNTGYAALDAIRTRARELVMTGSCARHLDEVIP
jgi:hypothetical protein